MNTTSDTQGFVPQEEWPDVSVMLDGFGAPGLPASDVLVGTALRIDDDNDSTVEYRFDSIDEMTWAFDGGERGSARYRSVEARPRIHVIDFLTGEGEHTHNVTMVVNLDDGRVTTADTGIVPVDGELRTRTAFLSGRVQGMGEIEPREPSDALVGKRIYYRYSDTERYEHIYLNSGTFVWHCIDGGEKGLADVDETRTFELADDIYIFAWFENVMPVDSFLVVDLAQRRSIGRMFCWEATTSQPVHIPFDSTFTVLNETSYPED